MSHRQLAPRAPDVWASIEPSLPFVPQCDRAALDSLQRAFASARPLTVLISAGKFGVARVIKSFCAEVGDSVDVVRIARPCSDATSCMREIISAIGFDSKDLSLKDLESIFRMFLSFQKTHRRRTVLCVEDAHNVDQWVLDKVRGLIQLELQREFGLMIILSGTESLIERLHESPLETVFEKAGQRITIAPLKLAETRELVRRAVESDGVDDVSKVIEFHAINLIHELSAGIPDAVSRLCRESFQLAHEAGSTPVTSDLVRKAAERLDLTTDHEPGGDAKDAVTRSSADNRGRLIARINGEVVQELAIDKDRILIGRDTKCDLRLSNVAVSRQHAVIDSSRDRVQLVDLQSTNGSFIDGRRVERYALRDNEVIVIGDCRIEYVAADYKDRCISNSELAGVVDPTVADSRPASAFEIRLVAPEATVD